MNTLGSIAADRRAAFLRELVDRAHDEALEYEAAHTALLLALEFAEVGAIDDGTGFAQVRPGRTRPEPTGFALVGGWS